MTRLISMLLLAVQGLVARPAGAQPPAPGDLASLFPSASTPGNWYPADSLRIYPGEKLYDLIDGGADVYLEYGFVCAGSRHYASPGGAEIDLEVYGMQDPGAAFGLCSFLSAGADTTPGFGEGGSVGEGFVIFWKNRFVVSVTALDERARGGVDEFCRIVDSRISASGRRPELAEVLLQPEFRNSAVMLVRGTLSFESRANLGLGNVFRVHDGSSGIFDGCRTFIMRYAGAAHCDSTALHALRVLTHEAGFRELAATATGRLVTGPRGTFIHMKRTGRYLLVTLGEDRDAVLRTAGKLEKAVVVLR